MFYFYITKILKIKEIRNFFVFFIINLIQPTGNVNHSIVWETLEETIRLEMIKEEEKYACCLNYITNMERNNYMHISFFLYENDIDNTISELASIIDWIGLCEKS